ncbi:MAG: guanylate kinase [Ruminiclostridium sp.]|nr:guanylate kinase [Ruminiclostridium sp.]MDE6724566.1 guanylate kinase [Ruminiclostridium sp.]
MAKGILFVVSAPAGCGKDTILEKALAKEINLCYSVSATTRAMRAGETEGISYYFKTREEFEKMIADGELLEHTEYCENYYGTPKQTVLETLELGQNVVLKIEIEGAENVKRLMPEAVLVFILPPSMQELNRRLHKRGTEDEETIAKRLKQAEKEISFAENYDYVIVNDDLDKAVQDLVSVVNAESFRTNRNKELIEILKNNNAIE